MSEGNPRTNSHFVLVTFHVVEICLLYLLNLLFYASKMSVFSLQKHQMIWWQKRNKNRCEWLVQSKSKGNRCDLVTFLQFKLVFLKFSTLNDSKMNCKCLCSCIGMGRFNLHNAKTHPLSYFCILWLFWCGFNDLLNKTSHSPQQLGKSSFCYFEHEGESCYGLCGQSVTAVLLSAVAPARGTQRVQCAECSSCPTFSKWL